MAWKPRFQTGTLSTKDGAAQVLARYRDEERGRIIYERLPREIAINTTPSRRSSTPTSPTSRPTRASHPSPRRARIRQGR
jgi:hypothetical protein